MSAPRGGVRLRRGTVAAVFGGVRVQALHPPCGPTKLGSNDGSLVLRLSHGAVDVLLSGDLEARGENMLLAYAPDLASEVLKAPHHGSDTSSTQSFVRAVAPEVAVVSAGSLFPSWAPSAEVVARYSRRGGRVLRTDVHGAVSVVSDGHGFRVETFAAGPGPAGVGVGRGLQPAQSVPRASRRSGSG